MRRCSSRAQSPAALQFEALLAPSQDTGTGRWLLREAGRFKVIYCMLLRSPGLAVLIRPQLMEQSPLTAHRALRGPSACPAAAPAPCTAPHRFIHVCYKTSTS